MTRAPRLEQWVFWASFLFIFAFGVLQLAASVSWLHRTVPGFSMHHEGTVDPLLPGRWTGAGAGIQVGDRIVGMNGVPLASAADAYGRVAALPPGTPVTYDVVRADGSRLRRTVSTMRFEWRDWAGIPVLFWLVGMVHLLIGALVSSLKPGDPVARAHLWYCWLMAVYFLGVFDTFSTHGALSLLSLFAQGLLGAAALHLASLLPRPLPVAERRPWLRSLNWALGLATAVGTVAGYYYGYLFGSIKVILASAMVGGLALPLAALWASTSPASSGLERSQSRIILWGSVWAFLPSVVLMMLGIVLGSIPLDVPELAFVGLLLFPAAIGYAIARHRLFELDEVVLRTITYALLSGVLVAAYFLLTGALRSLWGSQPELVDVLVTALIAIAFAPLRDWIKARVNAVFFRTEYDLTRTVADFARMARQTLDRTELVSAFASLLQSALQPSYLVLLTRRESGPLALELATGEAGPEELSLEEPHLQALIRSERAIALGADLGLPFPDGLWLPLTLKGELHGCLIVGPRKSGLPYRSQARRLLASLGQQLALWLQNAQLVDQVIRQTKELEQIEALKQADRLKDEFLSIISHELRTPISIIKGFGSVLKVELDGRVTDQHHYYLDKMLSATGMLSYLVNDLLDMSRIRAGKLRLNPDALLFREVVEEVSGSLGPMASERGQVIVPDIPDDLPRVYGDRQRIAQVLANLLSNALKFSPDGGTIWVEARAEAGELLCEVRDEGCGIEPEDLPKLFQRFTQLDMTATRQTGGTGLGLSISKSLIEAQRGRIGVLSTPGRGSTFWFTLPLVSNDD